MEEDYRFISNHMYRPVRPLPEADSPLEMPDALPSFNHLPKTASPRAAAGAGAGAGAGATPAKQEHITSLQAYRRRKRMLQEAEKRVPRVSGGTLRGLP